MTRTVPAVMAGGCQEAIGGSVSARVARRQARDAGLPLKLCGGSVPGAAPHHPPHCHRQFPCSTARELEVEPCRAANKLSGCVKGLVYISVHKQSTLYMLPPSRCAGACASATAAVAHPRCCYSCYHTRCIHCLLLIPAAPAAPPLRRLAGGPPTAPAAAAAGRRARAGAAEWPAKEARGWLWCAVSSMRSNCAGRGAGRAVLAWSATRLATLQIAKALEHCPHSRTSVPHLQAGLRCHPARQRSVRSMLPLGKLPSIRRHAAGGSRKRKKKQQVSCG